MPFPIDFIAGQSQTQDQMEQAVSTILRREGGNRYDHVHKRDGGMFNFSDGTVWVYQLSPDVCAVMFDAARASDAYLDVGVGNFAPMQIAGSKDKPPAEAGKPILIAGPAALCSTIRKDLNSLPKAEPDPFSNYVAPDDPHPSPQPGADVRLAHDTSGVAAECETLTRKEFEPTPFTVVRSVVTQNPRWGAIWRADIVTTDVRGADIRMTCWRNRVTGALARSKQPLEAIGSFPALAPLPGPDVTAK